MPDPVSQQLMAPFEGDGHAGALQSLSLAHEPQEPPESD